MNFVAIDFETANSNRSSICSVGIAIVEKGKIVASNIFMSGRFRITTTDLIPVCMELIPVLRRMKNL